MSQVDGVANQSINFMIKSVQLSDQKTQLGFEGVMKDAYEFKINWKSQSELTPEEQVKYSAYEAARQVRESEIADDVLTKNQQLDDYYRGPRTESDLNEPVDMVVKANGHILLALGKNGDLIQGVDSGFDKWGTINSWGNLTPQEFKSRMQAAVNDYVKGIPDAKIEQFSGADNSPTIRDVLGQIKNRAEFPDLNNTDRSNRLYESLQSAWVQSQADAVIKG